MALHKFFRPSGRFVRSVGPAFSPSVRNTVPIYLAPDAANNCIRCPVDDPSPPPPLIQFSIATVLVTSGAFQLTFAQNSGHCIQMDRFVH